MVFEYIPLPYNTVLFFSSSHSHLRRQLVSCANSEFHKLERVGPGETINRSRIARGVDVGVVVTIRSFEGEGGRVARLVPAGVVRATIPALKKLN